MLDFHILRHLITWTKTDGFTAASLVFWISGVQSKIRTMASEDKMKEHGRGHHEGKYVLPNDLVWFQVTYRGTIANSRYWIRHCASSASQNSNQMQVYCQRCRERVGLCKTIRFYAYPRHHCAIPGSTLSHARRRIPRPCLMNALFCPRNVIASAFKALNPVGFLELIDLLFPFESVDPKPPDSP